MSSHSIGKKQTEYVSHSCPPSKKVASGIVTVITFVAGGALFGIALLKLKGIGATATLATGGALLTVSSLSFLQLIITSCNKESKTLRHQPPKKLSKIKSHQEPPQENKAEPTQEKKTTTRKPKKPTQSEPVDGPKKEKSLAQPTQEKKTTTPKPKKSTQSEPVDGPKKEKSLAQPTQEKKTTTPKPKKHAHSKPTDKPSDLNKSAPKKLEPEEPIKGFGIENLPSYYLALQESRELPESSMELPSSFNPPLMEQASSLAHVPPKEKSEADLHAEAIEAFKKAINSEITKKKLNLRPSGWGPVTQKTIRIDNKFARLDFAHKPAGKAWIANTSGDGSDFEKLNNLERSALNSLVSEGKIIAFNMDTTSSQSPIVNITIAIRPPKEEQLTFVRTLVINKLMDVTQREVVLDIKAVNTMRETYNKQFPVELILVQFLPYLYSTLESLVKQNLIAHFEAKQDDKQIVLTLPSAVESQALTVSGKTNQSPKPPKQTTTYRVNLLYQTHLCTVKIDPTKLDPTAAAALTSVMKQANVGPRALTSQPGLFTFPAALPNRQITNFIELMRPKSQRQIKVLKKRATEKQILNK